MRSLFILVIILASGCRQTGGDGHELGNRITDFELTDLNGNPVSAETLSGKRVFLNIWATWCRPCIEEMPSIAAAQNILKDSNVVFVLASGEDNERIKRFRDHFGIDLSFAHFSNMDDFYIRAIPVTYLFDETRELIYTEHGARDWSTESAKEIILQKKNE